MPANGLEHETEPDEAVAPEEENRVGYCRPPRKNRFQPGQSGNPKGRPRGTPRQDSLAVLVARELERKVAVLVNGKKTMVATSQVLARSLVKCATTSTPAAKLVLELFAEGKQEIAAQTEKYSIFIKTNLDKLSIEEMLMLRGIMKKLES